MTFDEVKTQQGQFLATFHNQIPEWITGVGIGLPEDCTGNYILNINIREDKDIYKLHKHIMDNMPELLLYRVDITGEIKAF